MSDKFRRAAAGICALTITVCVFSACGDKAVNVPSDNSAETQASGEASAAEGGSETVDDGINAIFGDIRTEYNENLDLSDYALTASDVPADFSLTLEAEDGVLTGSAVTHDMPEASGGGYINGVNLEGDSVTMTAEIPYSGFYDLNFMTKG